MSKFGLLGLSSPSVGLFFLSVEQLKNLWFRMTRRLRAECDKQVWVSNREWPENVKLHIFKQNLVTQFCTTLDAKGYQMQAVTNWAKKCPQNAKIYRRMGFGVIFSQLLDIFGRFFEMLS